MKHRSLRAHLTLAFAIMALIPVLALGSLQVLQLRKITEDDSRMQMQTTYRLADAVQTYIYYYRNAVETLSTTVSASSPAFRTRDSLTSKLKSVKETLPGFAGLFTLDRQGAVTAHYPAAEAHGSDPLIGLPLDARPYFAAVRQTEAPFITTLYTGDETSGKPAIAIAAPVYDDAKHWDGLVVGILDLQPIEQLVTKYDYGTNAYPVVLDAAAKAVYRPDSPLARPSADLSGETLVQDARTQKQGSGRYASGSAGADELVTYTTIPDLNWIVTVNRSYQAVTAALSESVRTTLLLLMAALLVTLAVGSLLAKRLNRTIHLLVGYTEKLAGGEFREPDEAIASRGTPYELHLLAEHFFRMAGQVSDNRKALLELNRELERRVDERTSRLSRKNRELEIVNGLLTPRTAMPGADDAIEAGLAQLRDLTGLEARLHLDGDALNTGDTRHLPNRREPAPEAQGQAYASGGAAPQELPIPVLAGGTALGELAVRTPSPDAFTAADRDFLHTFSNTIAMLLQNDLLAQRLRREHETRLAVLESMSDAIALADNDGRLLYANRRLSEMFGIAPEALSLLAEETLLVRIAALTTADGREALYALTGRHAAKTAAKFNIRQAGGKTRMIAVSVFQVSGERQVFGRGYVWRDITKEHEIDALKNDLISLASHEFKTPITGIRGSVETLLRPDAAWDDAFRDELLEGIREDIGRIQNLVDEWLDISKIEAGALRVNRQPLQVRTLVEQAIQRMPQHAGLQPAWIESDLPDGLPLIYADRLRMEQVLVNLFTNAIRYNDRPPHIRIEAEADEHLVSIHVRDNGIGISAEHLADIFGRFYRVDVSSSRQTGGTGLGLAICKGIMEAHEGSIRVQSVPGEGSTFTVAVPRLRDEDEHEEDENYGR